MVALGVVDLLQRVEIDQGDPEPLEIEVGPRRAVRDREVPGAPRAEAGELIGRGDHGEACGLGLEHPFAPLAVTDVLDL